MGRVNARPRPLHAALAVCLALLAVGPAAPATTEAAHPGGRGRIVFTAGDGYTDDLTLWTANPDGSDPVQLTFVTGPGDLYAQWSPDGTRIAFTRVSNSVGNDIWVIDADGQNETQVTVDGGYTPTVHVGNQVPSWSPDGERLLFTRWQETWQNGEIVNATANLYTIGADGADRQQLTHGGDIDVGSWSPDGRFIAFRSGAGLEVMNADGSGRRLLVATPADGGIANQIDWTPDGSRVIFDLAEPYEPLDGMFTVSVSGGQPTLVDFGLLGNGRGDISPDGTRWLIVAAGREDLYTVAPGGGSIVRVLLPDLYNESWPDWQPSPPWPFGDIGSSQFRSDILWLFDQGIASGCGGTRFCPTASVTRGQMASFLARALDLPGTATDYFSDDETSLHETDINRVAAAGIASGCGAAMYCPSATVTRAQMASFLARAFNLPGSATDYFSDDETSIHETDINRVAKAAITSGCTATTYCPASPVTRGQMAAFLHRALD